MGKQSLKRIKKIKVKHLKAYWAVSEVVAVNLEHISHSYSSISMADFEEVARLKLIFLHSIA